MSSFLKFGLLFSLMLNSVSSKEYTVIGHRGNPCESPENTLCSFRQAIDLGANYIEFDVHLSKEGVPIVFHDSFMGRTTESSAPLVINALTLDEIQSYDAGVWFDVAFKGERVPTLEEVIDDVQGRVGLMIEIKTGSATEEKLAQEVLHVIQKARAEKRVGEMLIGSISPKVLFSLRRNDPGVPIIAIVCSNDELVEHLKNNPEVLALNHSLATPAVVQALHNDGRGVWAWCVDDECQLNHCIECGVDGFISNRPKLLIDKLGKQLL